MQALQKEDVFISQVEPKSLGEIIWNNVDQMFTDFISNEEMSLKALKLSLAKQTSALMTLALKQD